MKRWRARGDGSRAPAGLAEALQVSRPFLDILWRRGLRDEAALEAYLSPRLANLTNPEKWPQIPRAADILAKELLVGKKLLVWGDYDADGVTATALVVEAVSAHGFTVARHLPHRVKEGYGLNWQTLENYVRQGYQTLLTVDCGVGDAEIIDRATRLGMTVVVSDHHLPPDRTPQAAAIVNPRMGGEWPCENLAGVGVAFYLMAALNARLAERTGRRYKMDDALDLVALGTIADMMPLTGENRILVRAGLDKIQKAGRPGMAALKIVAGLGASTRLNGEQIAFSLAPRVNAVGRMGDAREVLNLLLERDYMLAQKLAANVNEYNDKRKEEEKRALKEALAQGAELLRKRAYSALVVWGETWAQGIVGIVAAKVAETFKMPVIAACPDGNVLKGSGRAWGEINLYEALAESAGHLLGFGGHKKAAGLRVARESLENFRRAFSDAVKTQSEALESVSEIAVDGEYDLDTACDATFLRELELMQPLGEGNEEPVFVSPPVIVTDRRYFGRSREHVKLEVKDPASGKEYGAKAWRLANVFTPDIVNKSVRLAYSPRVDEYRISMPVIDLGVKDWRLA